MTSMVISCDTLHKGCNGASNADLSSMYTGCHLTGCQSFYKIRQAVGDGDGGDSDDGDVDSDDDR